MADVIIVGAGVIGCAIAHALATRGLECTIVDDRPVAGGATQASAGMLAPYIEAHERSPLLDLAVRSLAHYDDWVTALRHDSGLDVEYRRVGTLEVAFDPDRADELRHAADRSSVPRTWLSAEEARGREPALGAVAGALYTPVHAYVSAPHLTAALAAAAARRGTRIARARVERIERAGDDLRVRTTAGTLAARTVVLAAGAWTNRIALDQGTAPPLRPIRGQLLRLGWHGHPIGTIIWGPECYIVPHVDGSVLVGATAEDVGFDERTTAAGVRDLLDAACDLLPTGWGASFLGAFVGLRPATPDALPVLGPDASISGLVHALGHYRNGVLLAPLTARLISDWIVDGTRDPAFDLFRPDRF